MNNSDERRRFHFIYRESIPTRTAALEREEFMRLSAPRLFICSLKPRKKKPGRGILPAGLERFESRFAMLIF